MGARMNEAVEKRRSAAQPSLVPTVAESAYVQTADDIKAQLEARVKSAYDQAMASAPPSTEVVDPKDWWNLFAFGPIQPISVGGPVLSHQVIKVGETAFVGTVLVLNPFLVLPPGVTPLSVLSNFALPYEVQYQAGNLTTWTLGPANMNVVHAGGLVPNVAAYVDVLQFTATTPGLYEMNISARLLGAAAPFVNAPQFAGYAREVFDLDAENLFFPFLPGSGIPGFQFDQPIRFQVYP